MGIPEYEAKRYEGAVKGGGTLLSVHCDTSEQIDAAKTALRATGASDISSTGEASADKTERVVARDVPVSERLRAEERGDVVPPAADRDVRVSRY
jgi:hypothetical protein